MAGENTKSWKVSAEATAMFGEENAREPSTPIQNIRIFSAKIAELNAQSRLENLEAEYLSDRIENSKRGSPEDEQERARLLEQMRKKRQTSAEYTEKSLALQSERATFLESTTDVDAFKRSKLLESILLAPTMQVRGECESRAGQGRWKQKLVEFYDAGKPGIEKTMRDAQDRVKPIKYAELWCPVLQVYLDSSTVTASHVVPQTLSASLTTYLTGTHMDTTMLLGNGILLSTFIERQLDKGGIALVPAGGIENPIELKLVIIDESIRATSYTSKEKWGDLDGRILKFKNSARPQKRFLYLRYAMTILYAWRHKRPGYETLRSTIWPSRLIWASPGKYVRKSSLQSIGGLIGEHFDHTFDDEEDSSSFSAMSQALTAKFRAVVDALPRDGDDDDGDYDSDDDAVE
jgi:hypothetical protein